MMVGGLVLGQHVDLATQVAEKSFSNFIKSSNLPTRTEVYIGAMGRVVTILFLAFAAVAVDAYAFRGQYFELSIQQGRFFASAVQQRLNKIGIL